MSRYLKYALLYTSATIGLCLHAHAQSVSLPPPYTTLDQNNVDLSTGAWVVKHTDITIGVGSDQLTYGSTDYSTASTWTNSIAYLYTNASGGLSIVVNGATDTLNSDGVSHWSTTLGTGSQVVLDGNGRYVYIDSSGTRSTFGKFGGSGGGNFNYLIIARLSPSGALTNYIWQSSSYIVPFAGVTVYANRISSMWNNRGYALKFDYAFNGQVDPGSVTQWNQTTGATALNFLRVSGCDLAGSASCSSLPGTRSVIYSGTGVTDSLGNTTQYGPNFVQFPLSSTPDVKTTYDSAGRVKTLTRPTGVWTYNWTVNGSSQVIGVTVVDPNPAVSARVATVDPNVLRLLTDTTRGRTTTYTNDSLGRVKTVKAPEGNYSTYNYDARGNILSTVTTGKTGGIITTSASFPVPCWSGQGANSNPNICNQPATKTDGNGNVTQYAYNADGTLQSVTSPVGSSSIAPQTRYSYTSVNPGNDGAESVVSALSLCNKTASCIGGADETRVTYSYAGDANALATSKTTMAGDGSIVATLSYGYNNDGDATTVSGPLSGMTTNTVYDGNRRSTLVVGPTPGANDVNGSPLLRRAVQTNYDGDGRVHSVVTGTSSDGMTISVLRTTTNNYDPGNRLSSSVTIAGATTISSWTYQYDQGDRLITTTLHMLNQGPDRITQNGLDPNGLLSTVTTAYGQPEASTVTYSYSPNKKIASIQDGNGNVTQYGYDQFDRAQSTRYADGTSEAVTVLDNNGNGKSAILRDSTVVVGVYNSLNNLVSRAISRSGVAQLNNSYNYDNRGRILLATGGSYNVARTYDAFGDLLTDTTGANTVINRYNAAGEHTYLNLSGAAGAIFQYDYLATGELAHIRDSSGNIDATFTYDNLGHETQIARHTGRKTTMTYGADLRLASLAHTLGGGPGNTASNDVGFGFQYNSAGQITQRTVSNDAYSFEPPASDTGYGVNGLNQLTTANGATITYDNQGNLKTNTLSPGSQRAYDAIGKLTSGYVGNGGATTTLAYDALDRLASIQSGVITMLPAWNGSELVGAWTGTGGVNPVLYGNGPSGLPVVGADFSVGKYVNSTEYFTDERGSLVTEVAANGAVLAYAYDAYGREASASHASLLGYAGGIALPGAGLVHFRTRAYDPVLGRWTSPDPIGVDGGINIYGYGGGDPVNNVDPSGEDWLDDLVSFLGTGTNNTSDYLNPFGPSSGDSGTTPTDLNATPPAIDPSEIVVTGTRPSDPSPPPPPPPVIPDLSSLLSPTPFTLPPSAQPSSPVQDEIVVTGTRVAAQRGGNNVRSTEFLHLDDDELLQAYKNASGPLKEKLQRELKGRRLKNIGKVRGGGIMRMLLPFDLMNLDLLLRLTDKCHNSGPSGCEI